MQKVDVLKTLNVLALAALVIHLVTDNASFVWVSAALLITAAFENPVGPQLAKHWLRFSECLGQFTTRLLLSVVYFVFLLPLALLYRLFNKELSMHFYNGNRKSLFVDADKTYTVHSFENLW